MCSHAECRVEVLPDGSVDETHVFPNQDLVALQEAVNKMLWRLQLISTGRV